MMRIRTADHGAHADGPDDVARPSASSVPDTSPGPDAATEEATLVASLGSRFLRELSVCGEWPDEALNLVLRSAGPGTRAVLVAFDVVRRDRAAPGGLLVTEWGKGFLSRLARDEIRIPPRLVETDRDHTRILRLVPAAGRPVAGSDAYAPSAAGPGRAGDDPSAFRLDVFAETGDIPGLDVPDATLRVVRQGARILVWQDGGRHPAVDWTTNRPLPTAGEALTLALDGDSPVHVLKERLVVDVGRPG